MSVFRNGTVLGLLAFAAACRPPAATGTTTTPGPAGAETICAGGLAESFERIRLAALADARSRGDDPAAAALECWLFRGRDGRSAAEPVPPANRAAVVEAVRRWVRSCGLADVVALTTELVRFQTVAEIAEPAENPEFIAMGSFLESWADDAGLGFRTHGPLDAWEIVLPGAVEERRLGIVMHADVVAVNDPPAPVDPDAPVDGWTSPPFIAVARGERLYGRGVEDDKGPIAAVLVALKALGAAGLVPDATVLAVLGNGEEHDWTAMKRYAAEAPPIADVVSFDAEFPVVIAEDGFVAWGLRVPIGSPPEGSRRPVAVDAEGGMFLTQIPDDARMLIVPGDGPVEDLLASAQAACEAEVAARGAESGFAASARIDENDDRRAVLVRAHGRSGHSTEPESNANALWLLSAIARRLGLAPNGIRTILDVVTDEFDGDHRGERLGLAYADSLTGPLVAAPTVLRIEDGEVRLAVNMRRPAGRTEEEFRAGLDAALERLRSAHGSDLAAFDDVYVGSPVVVDRSAPLVQTLLDVYRSESGDADAEPVAIRGGTWARLFPGAVSFGPCLPGEPYRGHGADENIDLAVLDLALRAIFDATVRVGYGEPR